MSYQQVVVRRALEGETVRKFMSADPVTVPASLSVKSLVSDYIYQYHFKMFPVIDNGKLAGCITTRQVKDVPREEWDFRSVRDVAVRCATENAVGPDLNAMKALALMKRTGNSRLMVVDDDRLVGIVSLKDIMNFLAVKLDLEEREE
jgi:predicted transcriptional regulator